MSENKEFRNGVMFLVALVAAVGIFWVSDAQHHRRAGSEQLDLVETVESGTLELSIVDELEDAVDKVDEEVQEPGAVVVEHLAADELVAQEVRYLVANRDVLQDRVDELEQDYCALTAEQERAASEPDDPKVASFADGTATFAPSRGVDRTRPWGDSSYRVVRTGLQFGWVAPPEARVHRNDVCARLVTVQIAWRPDEDRTDTVGPGIFITRHGLYRAFSGEPSDILQASRKRWIRCSVLDYSQ